MSTPKFTKKVEDFTCEHCWVKVVGRGFTNHCPKCLWSKHVDINPGDRASECGGLMEPIGVEVHGDEYDIHHRCIKCGYQKKNKTAQDDDFEMIIELSRKT